MRPVSSRFLQSSSSFERASSSAYTREREKENEGKREREVFSHEGVRSSRPLALRFFHPFFLSPPFSLSFIERLLLGPLRSSCSCLFFVRFSISSSYVLRSVIAHESLLSLAHFPPLPPGKGASSFSVVLVFRVVLFLFFRPLILLRVALFPSEFTPEREYFSFSAAASIYRAPFSLFLVLFCPCRSRCSALFEFKRGSHRCLVSPS